MKSFPLRKEIFLSPSPSHGGRDQMATPLLLLFSLGGGGGGDDDDALVVRPLSNKVNIRIGETSAGRRFSPPPPTRNKRRLKWEGGRSRSGGICLKRKLESERQSKKKHLSNICGKELAKTLFESGKSHTSAPGCASHSRSCLAYHETAARCNGGGGGENCHFAFLPFLRGAQIWDSVKQSWKKMTRP